MIMFKRTMLRPVNQVERIISKLKGKEFDCQSYTLNSVSTAFNKRFESEASSLETSVLYRGTSLPELESMLELNQLGVCVSGPLRETANQINRHNAFYVFKSLLFSKKNLNTLESLYEHIDKNNNRDLLAFTTDAGVAHNYGNKFSRGGDYVVIEIDTAGTVTIPTCVLMHKLCQDYTHHFEAIERGLVPTTCQEGIATCRNFLNQRNLAGIIEEQKEVDVVLHHNNQNLASNIHLRRVHLVTSNRVDVLTNQAPYLGHGFSLTAIPVNCPTTISSISKRARKEGIIDRDSRLISLDEAVHATSKLKELFGKDCEDSKNVLKLTQVPRDMEGNEVTTYTIELYTKHKESLKERMFLQF
jgi:hypothetical protein